MLRDGSGVALWSAIIYNCGQLDFAEQAAVFSEHKITSSVRLPQSCPHGFWLDVVKLSICILKGLLGVHADLFQVLTCVSQGLSGSNFPCSCWTVDWLSEAEYRNKLIPHSIDSYLSFAHGC